LFLGLCPHSAGFSAVCKHTPVWIWQYLNNLNDWLLHTNKCTKPSFVVDFFIKSIKSMTKLGLVHLLVWSNQLYKNARWIYCELKRYLFLIYCLIVTFYVFWPAL
jgi:hypothetical protein